MARNVEIKARVPDPEDLRRRVEALADSGPLRIEQEDVFFRCDRGRLKLRRLSDGRAELIHYQRVDATGPTTSDYWKVSCTDPGPLRTALERALEVRGVVRKRRSVYRVGQTRIHLDHVETLGHFLELEVVLSETDQAADGLRLAREVMTRLGVRDEQLVAEAYIDLVENGPQPTL